jgi:hypothetical protein
VPPLAPDEERRVVERLRRTFDADAGIVACRVIAEAEEARASTGPAFERELATVDSALGLFGAR